MFSLILGLNVQILFWLDCWCGMEIFKVKLPLLYELESMKSCYVTERVSNFSFTWKWKTPLRGNAVLREFMKLCSLINHIWLKPMILGFHFNINYDGVYRVNTLRRQLDSTTSSYRGLIIEWSKIIPLKVRCFV